MVIHPFPSESSGRKLPEFIDLEKGEEPPPIQKVHEKIPHPASFKSPWYMRIVCLLGSVLGAFYILGAVIIYSLFFLLCCVTLF